MIRLEKLQRLRQCIKTTELDGQLDHVRPQVDPLGFVAFKPGHDESGVARIRKDIRVEEAPMHKISVDRGHETAPLVPV